MVRWPKILGVALLPGGLLFLAPVPSLHAATSSTVDILSSDAASEVRDAVDLGGVKPLANRERSKPLPSGNPLWSVPLSALTATQERPIFSASRRPAQRAVVAPFEEQSGAPVPVKAAEPEQSPLALIGAVVGDSDAIAIFLDRSSQKIVRLRQGDSHGGWELSLVQGREVTLKKADRTEVLGLKSGEATPVLPAPTAIGAGATDTGYAPFVPRSTPKNGESDGL
jgi:general secretion pathway protein N